MSKTHYELTDEVFELDMKECFYFVGGEWKPWWITSNKDLKKTGSDSGEPWNLFGNLMEEATEDGRIVMKDKNGIAQVYQLEIKAKITKLKQ